MDGVFFCQLFVCASLSCDGLTCIQLTAVWQCVHAVPSDKEYISFQI
jgi:hypothetical protein